MPYTPDATNVAQPDGATVKASQAAPEFRVLKTYIRDVILAGLNLKAPAASPTFSGTAVFNALTLNGAGIVNGSLIVPTQLAGTADQTAASTAFVASAAFSAALPGAVSGVGLSISSDGTDAAYRLSAPDAIAILNMLGA